MAEHGAEVRLLRDALEEIVDDLCSIDAPQSPPVTHALQVAQMALEGEGE
jgi:hypothetical protein